MEGPYDADPITPCDSEVPLRIRMSDCEEEKEDEVRGVNEVRDYENE